ncbi:hypothetical protein RN001_004045 [Aquatica leii]|uniref:C2H2-type domain-containing protein n=1 Tax=Aquatica leii TaxID=1421715 RepID=A0AAN7SML8_9COLE|nr:hypothetical protein RN001_004045 [Aquatica leii]
MDEEDISCFLCKKQDTDCISISYREERNSVKDDLMELYGDAIEHYLSNEDPVCLNCAQILDNTVRLKRQVYEVIVDNAVNIEVCGKPGDKAFNFASVWITRSNNSYLYPQIDNLVDPVSPNDLLMVTGSIPYDKRCDPVGSGSRYGCDTPFLDQEVQRVTARNRYRRRGHKWTRRKSSNSRSRSTTSRPASRYSQSSRTTAISGLSRTSTSSKKKKAQQSMEVQLKRIVGDFFYHSESLNLFTREYLKRFVNNDEEDSFEDSELPSVNRVSMKTRFARLLRDKLLSEYQQLIYECPYSSCSEIMHTLEKITEHRVKIHNEMAMFWCEQCKFYYLTQEHLEKHKDMHFQKFIAYCIYCAEEYTNKRLYEEHLNEHLIHSFPCIYCDKFFLRKQLCENHVRIHHPGKKRKIKRIKPQSILDRIDKQTETQDESKDNKRDDDNFEVRILWQHGRPEETPRLNEDDLDDLNLENLVNIDLDEQLIDDGNNNQ